jgi:hypothetical protein
LAFGSEELLKSGRFLNVRNHEIKRAWHCRRQFRRVPDSRDDENVPISSFFAFLFRGRSSSSFVHLPGQQPHLQNK